MIQVTDGWIVADWQYVDIEYDLQNAFNRTPRYFQDDEVDKLTDDLVKWCKEYDGVGKFYKDTLFDLFYFERDEDREMFLLRWS